MHLGFLLSNGEHSGSDSGGTSGASIVLDKDDPLVPRSHHALSEVVHDVNYGYLLTGDKSFKKVVALNGQILQGSVVFGLVVRQLIKLVRLFCLHVLKRFVVKSREVLGELPVRVEPLAEGPLQVTDYRLAHVIAEAELVFHELPHPDPLLPLLIAVELTPLLWVHLQPF